MGVAQLRAAYERTLYCVALGTGRICFQIGQHDPAAEARLVTALGPCQNWTIITPCNPASVSLCAHENAARLENFQQRLVTEGFRWTASWNADPEAAWPEEAGALILDISLSDAMALGNDYGQYAIVHAKRGEAPQLVWLDTPIQSTGSSDAVTT